MAKALMPVLAVVSVIALPTGTPANGNGPLTREPVHEEVVPLQQARYDRSYGNARYPVDIYAELASVAAQQQALSGYDGANFGSAVSGATTAAQLASYGSIHIES
ncbi:hypothetical protein C7H84_05870 [Burkholderia sp. Nafp2/4-1b]|uniref:hypothetical protein n=1 Tax=Burkholderia sp. Nafp2/4-1b TaxID=2116686 RepID=UPI000EF891C8|nr:hypothetical protein [Burkholderia sp. Nafp2/4-1b]RKU04438.1 hypothetical protein C7H84_05870 [Burkholderia sp. Nafp2/4-1b]